MGVTPNPPDGAVSAGAGAADECLEFRLLGPMEIRVDGEVVPIGSRRRRVVLMMLLFEPGRIVTVGRLIQALWEESPPKTAETQVQICVSQLRSLLAKLSDADMIQTRSAGYLIQVPEESVDVVRFGRLVASGRAMAHGGDLAAAAVQLRAALDLWRGDVATDVNSQLAQAVALRLDEERLAVTEELVELELQLGRHNEHIGQLCELVTAYPLRERFHAQLALALYRSGRQAEALAACRNARHVLVNGHGIDPGEELRQLERAILDNDPDLTTPRAELDAVVPRQLPAAPSDFVGRSGAVARVCGGLSPPERPDGSGQVRVITINGAAGVGKTALTLHAAHQMSKHFPDGQLFARLRSTDAVPVRPEQILNQFLRALGSPPATLTGDLDELAAAYRSRVAGSRILVILDDAASERQVRPLIPGDARCALVVTSRQELAGLPGARRLDLDVLDPPSSIALLIQVIGESRVRAEPEAASALAEACDHLPLALQVAAAKLSAKSHWRIGQMVSRLSDERRRLDELTLNDFGVRPSISISYQALEPRAARLLLLLGALGASDFAGWVAGPLLEAGVTEAADVLDELVEARLVEVQVGAGHQARYQLHDLTRIFAREQLAEEVPAGERADAQHRLLRCWLFLARQAHRREFGGDYMVLHSPAVPWPLPAKLVDELLVDPIQWFQSEYANIISAVSLAAQLKHDELCWDLAVTSVTLFETRAYYEAWRDTHEVAMDAVRRSDNRRGEAVLCYSRGGLALAEKRLGAAKRDFERALDWFAAVGDRHGQGLTLRDLASIDRLQGRNGEALARSDAALAHLRSVGDRVAEASVLRRLAQVYLEQGQADEAETRLRTALAICGEVGVRRLEAQVQYRLGQALLAKEEPAEAETAFRTVLSRADRSGDVVGRANALLGIGTAHLARNELDLAAEALGDARETARRGGSRLAEGQVLLALADLRCRTGAAGPAAALLDSADAIFSEIGAPTWRARVRELRHRLALAERD